MNRRRHPRSELYVDVSTYRRDGTLEEVCRKCGAFRVVSGDRVVIGWQSSQYCTVNVDTRPPHDR